MNKERFEDSAQMMLDYGICKTIEEARVKLKASLSRIGEEVRGQEKIENSYENPRSERGGDGEPRI